MPFASPSAPSGETPGPVRLTVVSFALVALEVAGLAGYGLYLAVVDADASAWAGRLAIGALVVAFGLGAWQLLSDWVDEAETPR